MRGEGEANEGASGDLNGRERHAVRERGGFNNPAPGRPKRDWPLEGAESDTQCANVGALYGQRVHIHGPADQALAGRV
jgi:hypothetical protein